MSSPQIQAEALAAKQDGVAHLEVLRLASIGSFGTSVHNCHRELKAMYLKNVLTPVPTTFKVPCLDPKAGNNQCVYGSCSVLLPHDWFSALATHFEVHFATMFGSEKIVEFWRHVNRHQ